MEFSQMMQLTCKALLPPFFQAHFPSTLLVIFPSSITSEKTWACFMGEIDIGRHCFVQVLTCDFLVGRNFCIMHAFSN
jgi:hypothetical protein